MPFLSRRPPRRAARAGGPVEPLTSRNHPGWQTRRGRARHTRDLRPRPRRSTTGCQWEPALHSPLAGPGWLGHPGPGSAVDAVVGRRVGLGRFPADEVFPVCLERGPTPIDVGGASRVPDACPGSDVVPRSMTGARGAERRSPLRVAGRARTMPSGTCPSARRSRRARRRR